MSTSRFDLRILFDEIDRERRRQGLSWAALSRQVGVSASTIRRFEAADDAEADGVLALIGWLNTRPEEYIHNSTIRGRKLATITNGYVRVDMSLVEAAKGGSNSSTRRTRTTIQRLVAAAQQTRQPVADLTRQADA